MFKVQTFHGDYQNPFEYHAEVRFGHVLIWCGDVYGTDENGKTHSHASAERNAINIVGNRLQRLLED